MGGELLFLIPLFPVLFARCPVKVAIFAYDVKGWAVSDVICLARSTLVVVRVMNAVRSEVEAVAIFAREVAVSCCISDMVTSSSCN